MVKIRLYRCCFNYALSKLIVDNGLEDPEGRTQIPLSLPATIGPLSMIQDRQGLVNIKIAKNTKINHVVVSFANHYIAISIDRLSSKTNIGKYS